MNSMQLEQLISGYLDDELSPNRKLEVKNLLHSDPAAQKLYDEFVAMRNEIRQTRRRNLPHDFQKKLFERIDRETISVSGKRVEQTTSVDFTLPIHVETQPEWQSRETVMQPGLSRSNLLVRLKNPRVWVFPMVALIIGIAFFAVDFSSKDQNVARVPHVPLIVEEIEPVKSLDVPPPPLPGGGSISGNTASQSLAYKDGKPIVEITCELSPTARDSQYIPKLLADNGYSYIMRVNGNKAVTVWEFEISEEQVLPVLTMLRESNREELKSYKYPDAFLTLLNRSSEVGNDTGETPTVSTIIVRLNVTK